MRDPVSDGRMVENANWRCSAREQEHFGEGQRVGVRDRQERGSGAHGVEPTGGTAVKLELWRAGTTDHFHVAPKHLLRMTCSERFHRRFLCSKSPREVDCRIAPPRAVRDFAVREDAPQKAVAVSLDGRRDSRNVGRVEPQTDDGRH